MYEMYTKLRITTNPTSERNERERTEGAKSFIGNWIVWKSELATHKRIALAEISGT